MLNLKKEQLRDTGKIIIPSCVVFSLILFDRPPFLIFNVSKGTVIPTCRNYGAFYSLRSTKIKSERQNANLFLCEP